MAAKETIQDNIDQLEKHWEVLVSYLKAKVEVQDWHGASDACNDLRDTESEIKAYRDSLTLIQE